MPYEALLLSDPYVFPAYPPELPDRPAGDAGGPEYVVKASIGEEHERGLTLAGATQSDMAVNIAVSVVAPGIVRVLLEGEDSDSQRITLARDVSDQPVDVKLEKSDGRVTLVSDLVKVQIDLDPFHNRLCQPGQLSHPAAQVGFRSVDVFRLPKRQYSGCAGSSSSVARTRHSL